jgi:radical SAM-linked protein
MFSVQRRNSPVRHYGRFGPPITRFSVEELRVCPLRFRISTAQNDRLQEKNACFSCPDGHNAKLYMQKLLGDMHIAASNETILLVIKFRIGRSLRFLSHAETLNVFQRACVRAGIGLRYSQGFNPRPKLSLPLPRPVGVESDDELLVVRVLESTGTQGHKSTGNADGLCSFVEAQLSAQLPDGCDLLSVSVAEANTSFQPCLATYVLAVLPEYVSDSLKATIECVLASESLNVRRRTDTKNSKLKNVDVRFFLKSIELGDAGIIVECRIGPAGSIRVGEILDLLDLETEKLASPIRRTAVRWRGGES